MKNIEKGCLAIIADGAGSKSNVGTLVTVGKFLGSVVGFQGNDNWEIDQTILFTDGTYWNLIQEKFLIRIDETHNKKSTGRKNPRRLFKAL